MSKYEKIELTNMCMICDNSGNVVLRVKKTVQWTVFRESVDASFLSYLCFISVVGTFAKLIVFCPCQA